jgi:hypothetical protein
MRESGTRQERITISYFEGINSTVQQVIARRSELSHMENGRAPVIGVLEKREGQLTIGTDINGEDFVSSGDYGVVYYEDGGTMSKGLLRISSKGDAPAIIYYLNQSDVWTPVTNDKAIGLSRNLCSFANVEGNLIIVNGIDANRTITGPIAASTPMADATTASSIFNSPRARKIAFYKNRIYLGDYYDSHGNEMKTTILRSSYPLGIVSLINGDVTTRDANNNWIIPVTDTKYFYTDIGMNSYEIYRGNIKIATIALNAFTEVAISAPMGNVHFEPGFTSFLSADEIWVLGTFTGDKQYRWISNPSSIGRDVKQYDTFKLAGGDESPVTLLETIGNILMISNNNSMMSWNDYTLESFDIGVGCCARNGYVKLRGALYFVHYSGVYSTSGAIPQLLSRKIERYIKGATKAGLENAAAGFKGLCIFFTIGDVTLYKNDGSLQEVLPQVCIEFNIADQNWYVHTNVTSTQFDTFVASGGNERLSMCSTIKPEDTVYGPELITNTTFTGDASGWELGPNWRYTSNEVSFTKP